MRKKSDNIRHTNALIDDALSRIHQSAKTLAACVPAAIRTPEAGALYDAAIDSMERAIKDLRKAEEV